VRCDSGSFFAHYHCGISPTLKVPPVGSGNPTDIDPQKPPSHRHTISQHW
jgi:hypothetical protein